LFESWTVRVIYSSMNLSVPGAEDLATIHPHRIDFGVIPVGFLYQLKFSIQNNANSPMRMRLTVIPLDNEPNSIRLVALPEIVAPGLSTPLVLELTAEWPSSARYLITVSQNHSNTVYRKEVEANVVSSETFKHVKKSLTLQKRPLYHTNVSVVGNIPVFEQPMEMSYSLSAATSSELALMDDDDIEDLMLLPMVPNTYWDPFDKVLRLDPVMGRVHVDEKDEIEDTRRKTNEEREARLQELEDQGFFTVNSIERLKTDRFARSASEDELMKAGEANAAAAVVVTPALTSPPSPGAAEDDVTRTSTAAGNVTFDDNKTTRSQGSKANSSVASLLAMKRERLELQRRATVSSAQAFAEDSKKDSMVDGKRTLHMIRGRSSSSLNSVPSIPSKIDERDGGGMDTVQEA